jgi:hypothetical protein
MEEVEWRREGEGGEGKKLDRVHYVKMTALQ